MVLWGMMTFSSHLVDWLRRTGTAIGIVAACFTVPACAIVGNDNYSPDDLVDTVNVTGVGQMVVDQQDGTIGVCTATLINPRTVILAAHCVNMNSDRSAFRDPSVYGTARGGTPIAFFFNADNNAPDHSAIIDWFWGVDDGARYLSRASENTYNANYVSYMGKSTELGLGMPHMQADVAIAALDTPATDIPTWTLLFSPLTTAAHATIVGYGRNGTGSTGDIYDVDYRRRVAENTISFLGSFDDRNTVLAGLAAGLPQNEYMMDFNDPKFGTAAANQYDFNIFHDAALAKEASPAPGDSGGPLIVDQLFQQQVIAGVASGGSWFFDDQPSFSYGSMTFYQPLYLFWDWIVANNPYKYVSAKAGDGSWTDPTHWEMGLDPNYVTIGADGKLVNALPTTPAQGVPSAGEVNSPKFGQVCHFDTCANISGAPTPSANAPFAIVDGPGTTNFVPADTDGDVTHAPRYYDVTLSASGTTTLSSASAVIDRLTINGAKTGLTITSTGALGVLIDTTMYAGNLRVDGLLASKGDLALMGGVLSGNGTVAAPYTTAVLGAIAPGTVGTTGVLSIIGSVVLSSKSGLLIDVTSAANDRLGVIGGILSLGGTLVVMPQGGVAPKWHQSATIASADVIQGAFDAVPDTIAGVLYPVATKVAANGDDTEVVTFEAASFKSQLSSPSADQQAIGDGLDAARSGAYDKMSALYGAIDPLSDTSLGAALDALVPGAQRSVPQVALMLAGAHTSFMWQYMAGIDFTSAPQLTVQTGALKLAQNLRVGSYEMRNMLVNLGSNSDCTSGRIRCAADASTGGGSSGTMALPKGFGAFLSGQKIDGNVRLGGSSGKAVVDGYLIAGGIDYAALDQLRVGLSFGYGEADATQRNQPARSKTGAKQIIGYGAFMSEAGYFANGYAGVGLDSIHTTRQVSVNGVSYLLDGRTSATTPLFGIQLGRAFPGILAGTFKPAVGVQYGNAHVNGYSETGGAAALTTQDYSKQGAGVRIGFDSDWAVDVDGIVLKPQLHAFLVGSLGADKSKVFAGFAASPANKMAFDIAGDAASWADLGLKLDADVYDNTALGFYFNANPGSTGTYTAVGGSLSIKL